MKNKIDKSLILLLSFFFISSNLTAMENISPVGHCLDDLEENKMDYEIQEELEPEKDFPEVFFRSAQNQLFPITRQITGYINTVPLKNFVQPGGFKKRDVPLVEDVDLSNKSTELLRNLVSVHYVSKIIDKDIKQLIASENIEEIIDLYKYADDYLNINLPILAKPIIKYIYEKFGNKEEIENYIKENFNSPEAKITLAKEYFYQYGKVNQDIQRAIGIEERINQFLDIGEYYGFSIEELLQNNKIPHTTYLEHNKKHLRLSYLKIDSLKGLEQISEIDSVNYLGLTNNQLSKIEPDSFVSLGNIEALYLMDNNVVEIDQDAFNGLKNLDLLQLSNNNISKLENNVFNALPKLKNLLLYANNIKSLDPSLFKGLKNLDSLKLNHNQFEIIKDDNFKGLSNLRELRIFNNKIKDIESGAFNGLNKLEFLDLDNNNIDNLSIDVLTPLRRLERLNYNGNDDSSPELLEYLKNSRIDFRNSEKFFNNDQ